MSDLGELQVSVTADISDLKAEMASGGVAVGNFTNVSSAYAKQLQTSFTNLSASSTRNLNTLKDELKVLKESLFNETDINKIAFFNREIEDTKSTLQELQSVGLESTSKLGGALERLTDPSSLAATAVSRVRREIVGLGLSVVGGELLAPLISELGKYIESLFAATEATNKFALSSKELQKDFNSINQSSGSDQAKVLELVTALNSQTLSIAQTKAALKDLQAVSPQYFGSLTDAKGKVEGLTKAYDNYTKATLPSLQNKLDEKSLDAIKEKLNIIDNDSNVNNILAASQQQEINDLIAKGGSQYAGILKTGTSIISNDNERTNLLKQQDDILKRMTSRNFDGLIKPEKIKNGVKSIEDILNELFRQVGNFNKENENISLGSLGKEGLSLNIDETQNKINAIKSTIGELIKSKGLSPTNPIILELIADAAELKIRAFAKEVRDLNSIKIDLGLDEEKDIFKIAIGIDPEKTKSGIEQFLDTLKIKDPLKIPVSFVANQNAANVKAEEFVLSGFGEGLTPGDKFLLQYYKTTPQGKKALEKEFKDGIANANQLVRGSLADIGTGIGDALAGKGNVFGDVFSGLFESLGSTLIKFGEDSLLAVIAINALKKLFSTPLGIPAAIGVIAIGELIKTEAGSIKGFASGVQNFGGGVALVGERGPELVNLPRGSDVIPNHALGGIGGTSQSLQVFGQTITKGADIVTIYDRGVLTRKRNYRG